MIIYTNTCGISSFFAPRPKIVLGPVKVTCGKLVFPVSHQTPAFIKWFIDTLPALDRYQQLQITRNKTAWMPEKEFVTVKEVTG